MCPKKLVTLRFDAHIPKSPKAALGMYIYTQWYVHLRALIEIIDSCGSCKKVTVDTSKLLQVLSSLNAGRRIKALVSAFLGLFHVSL